MEDPKQSLLQRLRDGANVLVTVSNNPSVDQLAGAIGLTLLLNKLGKHATAVFSGQIPDVLEFLKPEATIEKNTDSLRDFIIALDKAKADKLRYKVEDKVVKIFITPYHTALTDKDLQFSQGDFNVDVVIAIGAHQQTDLDQAITSHGRILHDATVSSINTQEAGNLGTINWVDASASSLCEMIFDLCQQIQANSLDPQIATALLTGIVSETRRFGNDKTTAKSLETSSLLVAAGANQQLVAAKLEEKPAPIPEKRPEPAAPAATSTDANKDGLVDTHKDPEAVPQTAGTVTIEHDDKAAATDDNGEEIHIDEEGRLKTADEAEAPATPAEPASALDTTGPKFVAEPPALGGQLTANTGKEDEEAPVDPLSGTGPENSMPLLSHASGPALPATPSAIPAPHEGEDLDTVEHSVTSVPAPEVPPAHVDAARDAVADAVNAVPDLIPKPVESLNAQHIDLDEPTPPAAAASTDSVMPTMSFASPTTPVSTLPEPALPPSLTPLDPGLPQPSSVQSTSPDSPPPVPPPMMPPNFMPPTSP